MIFKALKRLVWVLIVGTMIAFHNAYKQEFKSLDDIQTEIKEDEGE